MPISCSVAATRHAISPRLAIRTFRNGAGMATQTTRCAREAPRNALLHPLRLALLEERREAVLRLAAAAHACQRLGHRAAVLLPAAVGEAHEQLLDPRLRVRRALQQLVHPLAHLGV